MTEANKQIGAMSDDEFLEEFEKQRHAAPEPSNDSNSGVPDESQASGVEEGEGTELEETGGAVSEEPTQDSESAGEGSNSYESEEVDGNDEPQPDTGGARADPHQGSETSEVESGEQEETTETSGAEGELAQLLSPLKAAKRTIEIGSVDKARQLMQMGVDYSRKMQDLKPYQRLMTSLERANLLDEDKLNFLIDLHNKRPEAIQKLLKDSEIDPLDLDLEDDAAYRPNDHMVPEGELAVDEVLDAIRPSPKFDTVVNTVSEWDTASKRALMDNPQVLQHLTAHMEAGIYDMILDRLESDRIFGKHVGLSDLDAYKAVGDAMHEEGAFAPNAQATSAAGGTDQGHSQDSKGSDASNIKARKRAASPPKGSAGKVRKQAPDFSQMSDEDIENFDWRNALT